MANYVMESYVMELNVKENCNSAKSAMVQSEKETDLSDLDWCSKAYCNSEMSAKGSNMLELYWNAKVVREWVDCNSE